MIKWSEKLILIFRVGKNWNKHFDAIFGAFSSICTIHLNVCLFVASSRVKKIFCIKVHSVGQNYFSDATNLVRVHRVLLLWIFRCYTTYLKMTFDNNEVNDIVYISDSDDDEDIEMSECKILWIIIIAFVFSVQFNCDFF